MSSEQTFTPEGQVRRWVRQLAVTRHPKGEELSLQITDAVNALVKSDPEKVFALETAASKLAESARDQGLKEQAAEYALMANFIRILNLKNEKNRP